MPSGFSLPFDPRAAQTRCALHAASERKWGGKFPFETGVDSIVGPKIPADIGVESVLPIYITVLNTFALRPGRATVGLGRVIKLRIPFGRSIRRECLRTVDPYSTSIPSKMYYRILGIHLFATVSLQ